MKLQSEVGPLRLSSALSLVGMPGDEDCPEKLIPLYLSQANCGFPSPADDYVDQHIDISSVLVRHPASTFFLRASGDSMIGAGINSGDLLVVDRSAEPANGRIVIAALDGELTVKRLVRKCGRVILVPENPDYSPIDITDREYVHVWGVVAYVIHKV